MYLRHMPNIFLFVQRMSMRIETGHYLMLHGGSNKASKTSAKHIGDGLKMDPRNRDACVDLYDNDQNPLPSVGQNHGTKCAGVAVASKNSICAIGSAFEARYAAIRMIGPFGVTQSAKLQAILRAGVDVSSNSWGGLDGTFDGPSANEQNAFIKGSKLRGGKGVIYVFAGGNGGFDDNCNLDGYVNSIYTIGINGVARDREPPGYAEPCSAILASAYTGKGGSSDNVCTTDVNGGCISSFTGTSAAAPLAAGALALVLESKRWLLNYHNHTNSNNIANTIRNCIIKNISYVEYNTEKRSKKKLKLNASELIGD
ncbi:BLI-like protein [Mya arenaria]|uniref:BLI-like protein n=1 Tax=Mya arenaria TaxID=6604 RepID=A0ABY7G3L8_MYAAR|nr:BLI-like protein [Mya arenaria]